MLVRERHQGHAADAGLQVLGGKSVRPDAGVVEGADHRLDRQLAEVAAEVRRQTLRVALRPLRREAGRHRDAVHALGPERIDRERRDERRVDPAREPEYDVAEAVLADVVAECQHERASASARARRLERGLVTSENSSRRTCRQSTTSRCSAKPGRACDDLAVGVDDGGVAVEDELVLAADEVAEDEREAVVARSRREHLLAALRLADVERRRGEVDEQLGSGGGEVGGGARLPDVLADGHADAQPAERHHEPLGARLEVALLVEDAVVREEALPVDRHGARRRRRRRTRSRVRHRTPTACRRGRRSLPSRAAISRADSSAARTNAGRSNRSSGG